jgi:hypothetical protein
VVVVVEVEELSPDELSAGAGGGGGGAADGVVVVVSLVVVVLLFEPELSQAATPREQVRTAARRASERLVMESSKHEGTSGAHVRPRP